MRTYQARQCPDGPRQRGRRYRSAALSIHAIPGWGLLQLLQLIRDGMDYAILMEEDDLVLCGVHIDVYLIAGDGDVLHTHQEHEQRGILPCQNTSFVHSRCMWAAAVEACGVSRSGPHPHTR